MLKTMLKLCRIFKINRRIRWVHYKVGISSKVYYYFRFSDRWIKRYVKGGLRESCLGKYNLIKVLIKTDKGYFESELKERFDK